MTNRAASFFPEIHDGETIFSICARFHQRSGNRSPRVTSEILLGCKSGYLYSAVPVGLDQLEVASYGEIMASEDTLRKRSILAAYLPFLDYRKRSALLIACRQSEKPVSALARSGLSRYNEVLRILKYCPVCADEHVRIYGTAIWIAEHQLPGVWLCPAHKRSLAAYVYRGGITHAWTLPLTRQATITPRFSVDTSLKILRVGSVVLWFAGKSHIDVNALLVMIRLRLRNEGLIRSELRLIQVEEVHLESLLREHYESINAPDVEAICHLPWFKKILSDSRHYNPLSWAMALAFCGKTTSHALESEYRDAQMRRPQRDLFKHLEGALRVHAPDFLYEAFTGVQAKDVAIAKSGLTKFEVDAWLRRDRDLVVHWVTTRFDQRRRESITELTAFALANSAARRIDFLRKCTAAYRWLEENDPRALQEILPPPVRHLGKQMTFEW